MPEPIEEMYSALLERFKGDLLRPEHPHYEDARAIWNGMVAKKPGLIARCADVGDVQNAVRSASATGILTAVRCGGHSLAGFSTCDGGFVIDLSRMGEVTVDPDARRAKFAGGCLLGSIDNATQKVGLVFPSGVVSHTGASGLAGTHHSRRRLRETGGASRAPIPAPGPAPRPAPRVPSPSAPESYPLFPAHFPVQP